MTERFDVVVSATGQLSRPRWPDIDGLDSFAGPVFHSAEWDHSVDLTGKRVASIGAGASAVQYVPQVAKVAEQVTIFQRTPNWIIPKNDRDYSDFENALIRRSRIARDLRRFSIWLRAELLGFNLMKQKSMVRDFMEKYSRKNLEAKVTDPDKVAKLTPDYPMGAKRVLFSDDYYEAIETYDVAIVTDPITKVTGDAIVTQPTGSDTPVEHPVDVIVVGTGFHTHDFLTPMTVIGPGGANLDDQWREGPQAYLGIGVHGFPNLFFMYGPNTNLGHNSIVLMIESQCRYLLSLFRQMAAGSIQAVDVRGRRATGLQRRAGEAVGRLGLGAHRGQLVPAGRQGHQQLGRPHHGVPPPYEPRRSRRLRPHTDAGSRSRPGLSSRSIRSNRPGRRRWSQRAPSVHPATTSDTKWTPRTGRLRPTTTATRAAVAAANRAAQAVLDGTATTSARAMAPKTIVVLVAWPDGKLLVTGWRRT